MLACLWDGAYKRILAANRKYVVAAVVLLASLDAQFIKSSLSKFHGEEICII